MNVHIVHLPHTFPYLLNLSLAFHQHGFERVTLVANGFDQQQFQQLQELTAAYDFVRLLDIPSKRILSHGQALNHAFAVSDDRYFCFADHDIFPTQNLADLIGEHTAKHDVVCFGDRPENTAVDYKGFAASATRTQSGTPLATSFFSVYNRAATSAAMAQQNIGFEQYFRRSQMPGNWAKHPDIAMLKEPFLVDTCKLLSLVMHQMDCSVSHLGEGYVCHLGGLCGAINRYTNSGKKQVKIFSINDVPNENELHEYYQLHQKRHPKVMEIKRAISDYALQLLIAHQGGKELPQFQVEHEMIRSAVTSIEQETALVFKSTPLL
ncbi:hypothetical protein OS175_05070 [Marinicella sp. S1101]|uniref:hypothetical protein n=1 Tax=Marinicella marina TaxID=2996016 RepID=UPI002260BA86|nr:hypothetical protein [Marinicella marina]MCX7553239.1 hypothetical protein [Marinicella marina]MDJ1138971.1 hypothetical protein [Marinicella marina]